MTYTDALAVLLTDALWRLRDAQDELQARKAAQPPKQRNRRRTGATRKRKRF